jgi:MFS family permease
MPVLALRLLGPLKMSGKQTGWVYATVPLACIFSPFVAGYLADKWFNAEWILLVSHAAGAVLLVLAARQTRFWGMFWVMLAYAFCFTGTLPLVNTMILQQLPSEATKIFIWTAVAWAVVGYLLTGMRYLLKLGGDGPDSLYLAAVLSGLMAVVAFFQVPLPPASQANPLFGALAMLKNSSYLLFIIVQIVVTGMMQFYYVATGQFMQDKGIQGRNVSAAMAIAQVAQAAATILLLGWLLEEAGFRWTLVIGTLCWAGLYATYIISKRTLWIVLIQVFHGLACVTFLIGGQIFASKMAPKAIGASAQSLILMATIGVGMFLGTQLAGYVMDKNRIGGKFQWSRIWAVPLVITLAGTFVLVVVYKEPKSSDFQPNKPQQEKVVAVAANL